MLPVQRGCSALLDIRLCPRVRQSGPYFFGDGNCDPVETIRTLKQIGFLGFLIPDYVPRMVDDSR